MEDPSLPLLYTTTRLASIKSQQLSTSEKRNNSMQKNFPWGIDTQGQTKAKGLPEILEKASSNPDTPKVQFETSDALKVTIATTKTKPTSVLDYIFSVSYPNRLAAEACWLLNKKTINYCHTSQSTTYDKKLWHKNVRQNISLSK